MKKIFYILAFFITSFSFAQGGPKVDVIKFRGEVTTTIRDTFDVPAGETWLIWNVTTSQLEIAGSDDVWSAVFDSSGFVTLSGIQTLTGQKTFSINPKIETYISLLEDGGSGSVSGYGSLWVGSGNVLGFTPANESFKARFDFPDLTADRTITFPDADVDLSTGLTDNQTLSLGGTGNRSLTISDGNMVDLSGVSITTGQLTGTLATGNYADDSVTPAKIAPSGTNGQVLTTVASEVVWADAGAGSDSGQTMVEVTGSTKTFALSDFVESGSLTGRKVVHRYATNDTITLPTGLGQTGRMLTAYVKMVGADTVWFKKGAGAVIRIGVDAYSAGGVTEDGVYVTRNAILELNSDGSVDIFSDNPVVAYTEYTDPIPSLSFVQAYWSEEDLPASGSAGNWTDRINSYVLTAVGDPQVTDPGDGGKQVLYDGTDDGHYDATDAAIFDPTPGTDQFWFAIQLGSSYDFGDSGIRKVDGTLTDYQYGIQNRGSNLRTRVGGTTYENAATLANNDIIVVTVSTSEIKTYVNGTLIATDTLVGTTTEAAAFSFGSSGGGTTGFENVGVRNYAWGRGGVINQTEVDTIVTDWTN